MNQDLSQNQLPKPVQELLLNLVQEKGMFDCMAAVQEAIIEVEKSQDSDYKRAMLDMLLFLHYRYAELIFPKN